MVILAMSACLSTYCTAIYLTLGQKFITNKMNIVKLFDFLCIAVCRCFFSLGDIKLYQ